MDLTAQKLSMSLDDIAQERKYDPVYSSGGKSKNTRRADRIAQSGPYQSRNPRHGNVIIKRENMEMTESSVNRRVYVGNLSWSVTWQDLKDHMRAAGDVEHANVLESNGRSKGCGIVTYATETEAQNAITMLNDTELGGRKIFVREDREEQPEGNQIRHMNNNKRGRVYVGNLSWNVKWQDLKDHMKQAGTVLHADVLLEPSGRSKGCGLVEFATPEDAERAIMTLNDTELDGRLIFVREDRETDNTTFQRHNETRQLYVGNLPWTMTWQSLKDLFRSVGEVERSDIAEFPDGRSRGFGFIRFANPADNAKAIQRLNGWTIEGRPIEVRLDKRE